MKKLRVLALMHKEFVPPDSAGDVSETRGEPWRMERDILATLRELGHEVQVMPLTDEVAPIRKAIDEFKPDVAFNCTIHFHDVGAYDAYVVSYLELLKTPYTGCNPRGLLLAGDKALSKKILGWHRIGVPGFAVFQVGKKVRMPKRLKFPLFVKSVGEHASLGISQASIVHDQEALANRVEFIHGKLGTSAIAEQYIQGRELTVGVIGNDRLHVLPVWEMTFDNLPSTSEPIATARIKWDLAYQKKVGLKTHPVEGLAEESKARIQHLAKRIYRALDMSGFARIDLRMDADENVYVLEANPNPDLSIGEDFAESASVDGIDYPQLIQRILNLGVAFEVPWKG
ncbi:MAG: D-alanine-D-alanine ligase [Planctomycetota bacterium]|jgi:D-alanine-D-alanine ligase